MRFSRTLSSGLITAGIILVLTTRIAANPSPGDDPYADVVVEYVPGSNPAGGFTTPETALGMPERFTGEGIAPGVVSVFQAAWRPDEIVSIGAGGHLTLQFNTPVTDDPNNLYGIDLLIFGNAFFLDASSPNGICGSPCTIAGEGGIVEVSADGITWHTIDDTAADGSFPTQGYIDADPYDPLPGQLPTRFTQPVDPRIDDLLDGATHTEIMTLFNGSGGGTPIDLAAIGLNEISFVRISNPIGSFDSPEIDAIADVSPRTPGDVNLDELVDVNDLLQLLAAWGPSEPADPPADFNSDAIVDVLDLLMQLANWS